jgi:hypothetical protein
VRSLDDLFQTFKTVASDDDMLLFARWYYPLLYAPSPSGGNSRHFVHGGIPLGPEGAGDGPRAECSDGSTVYAPRDAYQLPG